MKTLSEQISEAAREVYRILGSGHDEEIYQQALVVELCERGIQCKKDKRFEIIYKGRSVGILFCDIYAWLDNERALIEIRTMPALLGSVITCDHQKEMDQVRHFYQLPDLSEDIHILLLNFPYPAADLPDVLDLMMGKMLN